MKALDLKETLEGFQAKLPARERDFDDRERSSEVLELRDRARDFETSDRWLGRPRASLRIASELPFAHHAP